MKQVIFLFVSLFHLSLTFIKFYLLSIAIAVAVAALRLVFYWSCCFVSTTIESRVEEENL